MGGDPREHSRVNSHQTTVPRTLICRSSSVHRTQRTSQYLRLSKQRYLTLEFVIGWGGNSTNIYICFVGAITLSQSINLIRTTPRALQPFVVNTYIQPAYNTYVSLLPAYMRAHIYRKATRATEVGYSIVDYKGPLLPFKPPVLTLSFPGKTPMADFKELMKSAGANELSVKGQTIYVVPKYDASFIKAARNAKCLETSPSPDETVNLSALGPMITIRKIFSIFFKTHGYPMASGPGHLHDLVTLHLVEKPEGPIGGKRTREDDTGGSPSKKHHTELPVVNEDVDIDDVSDTEPEPSSKSSDSIVWALPNTNPRADEGIC